MGQPPKGRADNLELGSWNIACAECGRKRKSHEVRKLPPGTPGAGLYVCYPEHWEPRHPQEFVRGIPDRPAAPFVQQQNNNFVEFCTPNGLSAVPGQAVPGCMEPGYLSSAFDPDAE